MRKKIINKMRNKIINQMRNNMINKMRNNIINKFIDCYRRKKLQKRKKRGHNFFSITVKIVNSTDVNISYIFM